MISRLFRITLPDGTTHVGEVQGCGGTIIADSDRQRERQLLRVRLQAMLATAGAPLQICEPAPGCCKLYPKGDAENPVNVPLMGARVEWDE